MGHTPIRASYFFQVLFNVLILILRKVVFINSKYSQAIGCNLSGIAKVGGEGFRVRVTL